MRKLKWHIGLAALFLAFGILTAFVSTTRNPETYYSFISDDMASGRDPTASTSHLRRTLYERTSLPERLATFASFLFTHNARIGLMAFALGFAAGIPVFVLLFVNGLALGAMAAVYHAHGLGPDFWGWVLLHGVTELLAVALCGGAGLALAYSLVFPGRHTRLRNLALTGREAGTVVLGAVCLFFLAGLIEGIFRQTVQSVPVRYLVIVVTAAGWTLYFTRVGRAPAP